MSEGAALVGLAALGVLAAGCLNDPTEVVVVVDTDLVQGSDFQTIGFQLITPLMSQRPGPCLGSFGPTASALPATLGVTPSNGGPNQFDVIVTASGFGGSGSVNGCPSSVVTRRVSNIRFVTDETKAVFIPLLRKCECVGTTCAHALDAECRDITQPTLTNFDADHLTRLSVPLTATR